MPEHASSSAAEAEQVPAAAGRPHDGAIAAAMIESLQRSAAVARTLAGQATVSREPAAATARSVGASLMEANRPALEDIRGEALVRMGKLAAPTCQKPTPPS